MHFLNNIIRLLRKPFPLEEDNWKIIKVYLLISFFVAAFLYVFLPFGISRAQSNLLLICLGFGGVTFTMSMIFEFFIGRLLKLKKNALGFTFGKWILYVIGLILCISMANFAYIIMLSSGELRWTFFPHMIRDTFMVGIFPTVVLGYFAMRKEEHKYLDIAEEINLNKQLFENHRDSDHHALFDIPAEEIRYIESLQNYVKIGHVDADGTWKESTERATIKHIVSELDGSSIVKCHRSFLVNREAIISTSGNAQGLLLTLEDCEIKIPVSRSYVSQFRNLK